MKEVNSLSMDQVKVLLDNAPIAVYVSAMDDWELLYANPTAKNLFFRPVCQGLTCYQAAGFEQPCSFCRVKEMGTSELCIREFEHPMSHSVYQMSGKIIDWNGKPAHIEYLLDITEKKKEEDQLRMILSSIPCGLSVYQFDGKQISPFFHNATFYEIMGYSEEHIEDTQQETSFLGVHRDDLGALQEKIEAAIQHNGIMQDTYRIWNDTKKEYRWIHLDGSVKTGKDGRKFLYGIYSDVSEEKQMEKEMAVANEKIQAIVNAIPGGVAIYKISDIFETVYFSDGVPELSGYTVEEYQEFAHRDAVEMTYWEDTVKVVSKAKEVIENKGIADLEFRKLHRDGHIVWVHAQVKWLGEEDGCPMLHCVFHNISDLKEAQLEMDSLVNSIPGGIASFRLEKGHFIAVFFSDGVMALSGHTREEYYEMCQNDLFDAVYELDRERVKIAAQKAFKSGRVLDISYRMYHKNGHLIWIHLSGQRVGVLSENAKFYAVYTGMSAEARLFQTMANETTDAIYVIDKKNYDLLYVNESRTLFTKGLDCLGKKCYKTLHGKDAPCEFCTLGNAELEKGEHEMVIPQSNRSYRTHFRELDWNGIPAYVKYVRDITEEVNVLKEKQRLEIYFKTLVEKLPSGISVICREPDGKMEFEFVSQGFADMVQMTMEELKELYSDDIFASVHPDDIEETREKLLQHMEKGEDHWELVCRLQRGDGGYTWFRIMQSLLETTDGSSRLYSVYTDISDTIEEKKKIRRQYEDLIFQHYRAPGPNALIIGHCNVTQNKILEIVDYTNVDLLKKFGTVRQEFFLGIASLIVDPKEKQTFLDTYLNEPSLAAFERDETEQILECFIKFPQEARGRYVQFKVVFVETPGTGDVTGILTVTDITDHIIQERILHQLSSSGYDCVINLDLDKDWYTVLASSKNANDILKPEGCFSERIEMMLGSVVVPKDLEQYAKGLDPKEMYRRLKTESFYSFPFSIICENGDIRTKKLTVSAIDLRLGRVCLLRSDITDSIREQQGLLHMMAYTFELMVSITVSNGHSVMYTRQAVLENLPPYVIKNVNDSVDFFIDDYVVGDSEGAAREDFYLETMLRRLHEVPTGYDFVVPCQADGDIRYKQINVLWGDENHRTICVVRADVTDILTAERQTKKDLEEALSLAKEASSAKSDFLSAMSHDIRTPMNAITGMTALAIAHIDDHGRVEDCLQKITVASKHLLSLINNVLDMSRIERSKISLSFMKISLPTLVKQLCDIMEPQANETELNFNVRVEGLLHEYFYGDSLRISQILINILSNAVKFTPKGGKVSFLIEEIPSVNGAGQVRYRFTVSDTGVGMPEEFLAKLFDPFTRSFDAVRTEGTGLGLSITKGLVDLMGGDISVESQANQGSTFRVELEYKIAQEEEGDFEEGQKKSTNSEKEKQFTGFHFLVVEDNGINAEILCELLSMYGATSVVKTDGLQAVNEFGEAKKGSYDAILMDIQMPEMNGYEATRVIRKMEREDAKTIPIVAMTANAFAEDIQAATDAGMNAHISKPIDIQVLCATLTDVLEQ